MSQINSGARLAVGIVLGMAVGAGLVAAGLARGAAPSEASMRVEWCAADSTICVIRQQELAKVLAANLKLAAENARMRETCPMRGS